jgi:hypothetical protein
MPLKRAVSEQSGLQFRCSFALNCWANVQKWHHGSSTGGTQIGFGVGGRAVANWGGCHSGTGARRRTYCIACSRRSGTRKLLLVPASSAHQLHRRWRYILVSGSQDPHRRYRYPRNPSSPLRRRSKIGCCGNRAINGFAECGKLYLTGSRPRSGLFWSRPAYCHPSGAEHWRCFGERGIGPLVCRWTKTLVLGAYPSTLFSSKPDFGRWSKTFPTSAVGQLCSKVAAGDIAECHARAQRPASTTIGSRKHRCHGVACCI